MSVNNSLIPKQHDRPFISMCGVVYAATRVYGVCVFVGGGGWCKVGGCRLELRFCRASWPPNRRSSMFFACTQSFGLSPRIAAKDEFLHQCPLITLLRVNILLTGKGKHEKNSQYVSFCTLWNYLNESASS